MKEVDWDNLDDGGIVDFDQIDEPPTPKKELNKKPASTPKPREEPPKSAQKVHVEPPPGVTPKQEKIISNATKQAQKLSKELETLDYQLDKFIKFENKISSFKIKNTIAIGSVALILGGYIGSLSQSELNTYYVNQEVKHKLNLAAADVEMLKKARAAGVVFAIDNERIVMYTTAQNRAAAAWEDKNHKGLQIALIDNKK